MKILIVSSEVTPFAKTGGLADVAGSLPVALAELGHDVRVAMPKYGAVDDEKFHLIPILGDIIVRLNGRTFTAHIKRSHLPGSRVPVYFVLNAGLFERDGLYGAEGRDFADNATRFAFFCKAVVWLLKGLDWVPDIVHCNDWQTALIPVFLRTQPDMTADPALQQMKVVFTIHNLAYQGLFPLEEGPAIGIGPELLHPKALEFYGKMNLMKGGLVFADALTTVSRRYAEEIQTPEFGCGLEGLLQERSGDLTGIMNGVDYGAWNPETDPLIPARYSSADLTGKAKCKAALQAETGLAADAQAPLIGIISRLDRQKGFDLIAEALDTIVAAGAQIVLLGTGMPEYHTIFERAARQHPGRVSANLRFDNALAHHIEAGADMFLMPSRYEPCGLNQLYSLRYGTVPIVRATGGLADSVTDATAAGIRSGKSTGFVFEDYTAAALLKTVKRAIKLFGDRERWVQLMRNGMARDFSWTTAAGEYAALYERLVKG